MRAAVARNRERVAFIRNLQKRAAANDDVFRPVRVADIEVIAVDTGDCLRSLRHRADRFAARVERVIGEHVFDAHVATTRLDGNDVNREGSDGRQELIIGVFDAGRDAVDRRSLFDDVGKGRARLDVRGQERNGEENRNHGRHTAMARG